MKRNILKTISGLVVLLAILIVANLISANLFYRLDLTVERRYSLSSNTKELLKSLDHEIVVNFYLEGNLNSGFRKLAMASRDMLDEFKIFAKEGLYYERINPNEGTAKEKKKLYDELQELKCEPTSVYEAAEDGRNSTTLVFPYAIIHYQNKTTVINLLENITGYSGPENLNKSIEGLEYKIIMGIRKLIEEEKPRIAFLEGHGELDEYDVMDATSALSEFYQVERGRIGNDPSILEPYKAIIIAKPSKKFSEKDKFIIDQYFMNGGSVMWLIDAVNVTLDSLRSTTETVGIMSDYNLRDQLFKYGVRINPELIEDVQAARIQINGSAPGQPPRLVAVPWLFNPLLLPNNTSSITRNMNVVKGEFVSTIDTVGEDLNIQRKVLFTTSQYAKLNPVPVYVTLAMVNERVDRRQFNQSYLPVAYLQEGIFPSVFQNRMIPSEINIDKQQVILKSEYAKMIVIADGDIIKNKVRYRNSNPQIMPLGYDEASGQEFGNKEFILNAVSYLTDNSGWMELRSRNYRLRLLDKDKLSREVVFWKIINVVIPVIIIIVLGIVLRIIRHKRYAK